MLLESTTSPPDLQATLEIAAEALGGRVSFPFKLEIRDGDARDVAQGS